MTPPTAAPTLVVKTPLFRMAFCNLIVPKLNTQSGKLEYGCNMLFDKSRAAEIIPFRKAAVAALEKKWGVQDKWPTPTLRKMDFRTYLSPGKDGWPIRDGDLMEYDGFANMISIGIKSHDPITVVDANRVAITDKRLCCSGMEARAIVKAAAYDSNGNKGVSFWISGFQVCRDDGTRFGGQVNPNVAFDDFEDPDAEAPADSGADYSASDAGGAW